MTTHVRFPRRQPQVVVRAATGRPPATGSRPRRLVGLLVALLVGGCASVNPGFAHAADGAVHAAPAGGTSRHTLVSGGLTRSYLLHLPARRTSPTALVVALHGRLGNGQGMRRLTGYDELADREGFVVVYPDGLDRGWADGRGVTPGERLGVDDVAFLSELIDTVTGEHGVDPRRVFVAGMSNGAFMAERYACQASSKVAAIVAVAGTMGTGLTCRPSAPVSVMQIGGTSDPIVPFDGGTVHSAGGPSSARSAPETAQLWRQADRCRPEGDHRALPEQGDGTSVTEDVWAQCADGTAVVLYTVRGGGHTWPGGPQYLPRPLIGPTTRALSASEVSWEFFREHARR